MRKFNFLLSALAIFAVLFVSSCKDDVAEIIPAGKLTVTSDKTTVTVGGTVNFEDASENAVSRAWTFLGGTPAASTDPKVEVTYSIAGDYKATANVIFLDGTTKKEEITITVSEVPVVVDDVVASFSADPTSTKVGMDVVFTDTSTGDADSWEWTFEGGTPATSTEQNPTVRFAAAGTYNVTLKVTRTSDTNTNTKDEEDFITITAPVVDVDNAEFASATTNAAGTEVVVMFSEMLNDPAGETFEVKVNGTVEAITSVALDATDAMKVILTLTNPITDGLAPILVSYAAPAITTKDGGSVTAFTDQVATNNITIVSDNFLESARVDWDFAQATLTGWTLQEEVNTAAEDVATAIGDDASTVLRVKAGATLAAAQITSLRTNDLGAIAAGDYELEVRYRLEGGDRTVAGALEVRVFLDELDNAITVGAVGTAPGYYSGIFKMQDWTLTENINKWYTLNVPITLAEPLANGSVKFRIAFGTEHADLAKVQFDYVKLSAATK